MSLGYFARSVSAHSPGEGALTGWPSPHLAMQSESERSRDLKVLVLSQTNGKRYGSTTWRTTLSSSGCLCPVLFKRVVAW